MKFQHLVESSSNGATLFFKCKFYFKRVDEKSLERAKDGDIRLTAIFSSKEESSRFVRNCRTNFFKSFFKDVIENGFDFFYDELIGPTAAEKFGVYKITKVEIDSKVDMILGNTSTSKAVAWQNEANNKWYYSFVFDNVEEFAEKITASAEDVVRKHFGNSEILLDTLMF